MRYLVFAYDAYYPAGARTDLRLATDSQEAVDEFIVGDGQEYAFLDVFDIQTKEITSYTKSPRNREPIKYEILERGTRKKA